MLYVITFALAVVIGTFSYIAFDIVLDVIAEQRQARERDEAKKRE